MTMKRVLTSILVLISLSAITFLIILYGRGYRLDFGSKTVETKGLLVANSQPNGAHVFIDGKLTSATNSTITLDPGNYQVRIEKEGYSPWSKEIRILGEVVAKTDTILFPINPSLSPITITGASNPKLSPDSSKIVFSVSKTNINLQDTLDGNGVFIIDMNDRPLGVNRTTRQIAKSTLLLSFEQATFKWDPTSKKILAKVKNRYYLLDANLLTIQPQDVTLIIDQIEKEWQKDKEILENERLSAVKAQLAEILTNSTKTISWSPDDTKILYEATRSATIPQIIEPPLIGTNPTAEERTIKQDQIYVYDIKEDKNFLISDKKNLPKITPVIETTEEDNIYEDYSDFPLQWFPTSSHLLLTEENKISVLDYDGTNRITLYAGPFTENLVAPWPNGSKIVILTTLNPQPGAKSNLYAINIR